MFPDRLTNPMCTCIYTMMLLFCVSFGLAACGGKTASQVIAAPVPAVVTTDAQTVLDDYNIALGAAQQALKSNPTLLTKVNAITAKAAPYIAALQTGVTTAENASSVGSLALQLLFLVKNDVTVTPN